MIEQGEELVVAGEEGRTPLELAPEGEVDPCPLTLGERLVGGLLHPIVEELEEFAAACRGEGEPEVDGEKGTASLAVLLAGIQSAAEGRRVEVAEVLNTTADERR